MSDTGCDKGSRQIPLAHALVAISGFFPIVGQRSLINSTSEISEHDTAFVVQQDVSGFDVAVDLRNGAAVQKATPGKSRAAGSNPPFPFYERVPAQ